MWHPFFQKAGQDQFTSTVGFSEAVLLGVLLAQTSSIQSWTKVTVNGFIEFLFWLNKDRLHKAEITSLDLKKKNLLQNSLCCSQIPPNQSRVSLYKYNIM